MSLEYSSYEITSRINGNGKIFAIIMENGKEKEEHEVKCRLFEKCKGKDYNLGFVRHLCTEPMQCATANPGISIHPAELLGQRASRFTPARESMDYA